MPYLREKLVWLQPKEIKQAPFTSLLSQQQARGKKTEDLASHPELLQHVCQLILLGSPIHNCQIQSQLIPGRAGTPGGRVTTIKIDCVFLIQHPCRQQTKLCLEIETR